MQDKTTGKLPAKIIKIGVAIIASFVVVCGCIIYSVANSSTEQTATSLPTLDVKALSTQIYETTVASILTSAPTQQLVVPNTPQLIPTSTLESTQTPFVFSTPTMGGAISGGQIAAQPSSCISIQQPQFAKVVKVVDGDTIRVIVDGVEKPIRYIGIDTPESTIQHEYFGEEASAKNKELVEGQDVILYRDISETDKYDRLLRYVYVENKFINLELVKQGFASAMRYKPDTACANVFEQAQTDAQRLGLGMWAANATQAVISTQSPSSGNLKIVLVNKVDEFVDVINDSSASIDLTGWTLVPRKAARPVRLAA
jgi:micrococcal nuclease